MRTSLLLVSLGVWLLACDGGTKKRSRSDDDDEPRARSASASASASAALPPRGEPPSGWSLLAPLGGGYSVWMPGTAERIDTGFSVLQAVKRASGSAYMATCMETKEPDEAFKGMRRGKIGERKLLSAKPIDDARGKGERLAIELVTDKGILVSNELLLMGKTRVCSFTALVPQANDEAADIERFFDSARFGE